MCENKLTGRLKEEIEKLKGGVTEAASHLNKSRNTIYNWMEKGNAPIDQLEKLTEIGVDIQYILTGITTAEFNNALNNVRAINETTGSYKQNTLDSRLNAILSDYIHNDNLILINQLLNQALTHKKVTIDCKHPAWTACRRIKRLRSTGHERAHATIC